MPRIVKDLLGATACAGVTFLISLAVADQFTLLARLVTALFVGALCLAYFQFIARLEKRRPPEPPYRGEEEGE